MTHSDAEDNTDQKMNLYFTYKSQNSLFLTVKTISKLNMECSVKFGIKTLKLAVVIHILQTMQNLFTSCCRLAQALFLSLTVLF